MNIGVLSGKGGTGKTMVSTNMALKMNLNYVDCDVEEPNGFIFLKPKDRTERDVLVDNPYVDESKCILCGECVENCYFNALAKTKKIILFEKLCHSCGACELVCPVEAISYVKRPVGQVTTGIRDGIICIQGQLNVSEAMAVPVIKSLLEDLPDNRDNIVDCAPGTSCNVVNTLEYMDRAVLVTEPTRFGLHDLERAVELCRREEIPFGVIVNRDHGEKSLIDDYCKENNVKILGKIPYERDIAELYSRGELVFDDSRFSGIFDKLEVEIRGL